MTECKCVLKRCFEGVLKRRFKYDFNKCWIFSLNGFCFLRMIFPDFFHLFCSPLSLFFATIISKIIQNNFFSFGFFSAISPSYTEPPIKLFPKSVPPVED